jgi:hypothetical protein
MPYGTPQGMPGLPQGNMVPMPGMNAPAYHPIPGGGQGPPSYAIPPHPTVYGVPRNTGPTGLPPTVPPAQRSVTPPVFPHSRRIESTTPPGNPPPGVPLPPRHGTPLDFTKLMHAPDYRMPVQQSLSHQPSVGRPPARQSPQQQPMALRSPMRSPQEQERLMQQQQRQGDGQQVLYGGQLLPYDDVVQMKKRDERMYSRQYVDTMERMAPASLFRGVGTSPPVGEAVKRSDSGKKWI